MSKQQNIVISTATTILIVATLTISAPPVYAGSTGWGFVGGVAAARIGQNMRRQTQAAEVTAYNSSRAAQPVQQAAPASATQTTEQKLNELSKLAAGGYITPEEYKAKKQAILDTL